MEAGPAAVPASGGTGPHRPPGPRRPCSGVRTCRRQNIQAGHQAPLLIQRSHAHVPRADMPNMLTCVDRCRHAVELQPNGRASHTPRRSHPRLDPGRRAHPTWSRRARPAPGRRRLRLPLPPPSSKTLPEEWVTGRQVKLARSAGTLCTRAGRSGACGLQKHRTARSAIPLSWHDSQ